MPSLTTTWISDQFEWNVLETPPDEVLISIGFLGKLTKRAALQKFCPWSVLSPHHISYLIIFR